MSDRQKQFLTDLQRDIPEIVEYMKDYNGENIFYLRPRVESMFSDPASNKIIDIHITDDLASNSSYHLFCIPNYPIAESAAWGILDRSNLSFRQPKDLKPIVREWCIDYEKRALRKYKLERICQ